MTSPTETRTITCQATSIFAWSFVLADSETGPIGMLHFTGFFGRPIFDFERAHYSVFSGHTLMQVTERRFLFGGDWIEGTEPIGVAQPSLAASGGLEIQAYGQSLLLQRNGGSFDLVFDDATMGTIQRTDSGAKRSRLTCDTRVPILLQLFCLVLALQRWRKEADRD